MAAVVPYILGFRVQGFGYIVTCAYVALFPFGSSFVVAGVQVSGLGSALGQGCRVGVEACWSELFKDIGLVATVGGIVQQPT